MDRHRELTELATALAGSGSNPTVVVMRGVGGVGKTALALRWLGMIGDRYPDGHLFAELTQASGAPVPVEDVLGRFLRALGVPTESIPATLVERTTLYRSVTAGSRLAVLLDDVTSAAQARVLLPTSPDSVVVATSRRPLIALVATGAVAVRVEPLPPDGALRLLTSFIGEDRVATDRGNAELLVRLCGGLPIALCVAAALVVARPRRSLANLVERLRDEHRRLDVLSIEEDYSVRATFDLAYRELPAPTAAAYRAIGLSPGGLVRPELLAHATGTPVDAAADTIEELVDAGLVDELDEGWYRPHNLVHVHAKALATGCDDATAVLRRVVDWYVSATRLVSHTVMPARQVPEWTDEVEVTLPPRLTEYAPALDWLDRVRDDVVLVMRSCLEQGWHESVYLLGYALQPLFVLDKQLVAAIEVCDLARRAAAVAGEPEREAKMRKRLARLFTRIGQYDSAEREIRATILAAEARSDVSEVASAHKSLGLLAHARESYDTAVAEFETALATMRTTGPARAVGLLLTELGSSEIAAGQPESAVDHLTEARELLATLDKSDEYNTARADRELARAHMATGDLDTAGDLLRSTLAVFERHQARHEAADTHRALAELSRRAGDPEEERRHNERAAAILEGLS
ncbi:NB-ARC domain-containing protein [Actinokineospora inagensis]|uniref:NB-ARC domain-containing protein n=1 Tax=Actinokineospora inagensis TaxID=103730 RepID=UPI00146FAA0A|nr:NB-ARC domain-containing protein [Actinokineospora inagensis]